MISHAWLISAVGSAAGAKVQNRRSWKRDKESAMQLSVPAI